MRWWRKRPEQDFAEEIRAHLDLEQQRLEGEGISAEEARAAARRAFGNLTEARERYHETGRWIWADGLLKDLIFALRMLRQTPWFTASAILILALAIGANLVVFNVIDALMLRSIPVSRPEELARIDPVGPQGRVNGMPSTALDFLRQESVFNGVCGFATPRVTTNINGAVASTGTLTMTGDCLETLGVATQIGRPLTMEDDRPEAPNVVVLTASLWRRDFAGSSNVLGKQIQAGAETFTVIGVAADRFTGVLLGFEPGLIIPLHHTPTDSSQKRFTYYWVTVFGRLAPKISQTAAAARIDAITPALLEQSVPLRYNQAQRRNYLANHLVLSSARTGVDWMLRDRFGGPLFALMGICAAILSIACLNLAGLLVARALARRKEIGIRLAIGASTWRVMRPLALESLFLTIGGAISGIVCSYWASRVIAVAASSIFSNFSIDTSLGARAWALLAGLVALVAATLTVVPAWQARRSGGNVNVHDGSRGIVGSKAVAQKVIITVQIAFTLALVTASAVFASSFAHLIRLPLGFRVDGIAEAMFSPLPGGYSNADPKAYYSNLLDRLASLPGVQSASFSSFALFWQKLFPELVRTDDGGRELRAQTIRASEGYFRTIGVNLIEGQDFRRDRTEADAIVSESVAKLLGDGLLGRYIQMGETGSAKRYRVIGVAPTMRVSMADVRESSPLVVYLNFWEDARQQRYPVLFVRGIEGTMPDAKAVAAVVRTLGREYVEEYRSLVAQHGESIVEDRLLAYLSSVFGLLALVLAAIGLFAILSCYVASRTGEIGIRMALGADAAQIRGLVLGQIGPAVLAGVVSGTGIALAVGRVLAGITYGVTSWSPLLLGAAVLLLALTAYAASLIPAARASSIQPLDALRDG